MTATPSRERLRRLGRDDASRVAELLESGWGTGPAPRPGSGGLPSRLGASLPSQHLLDALDRGEHDRFLVWPAHDPVALLYSGRTGTLVPAGDPAAAGALSDAAERLGWRVMVGDAPLGWALLEQRAAGPGGLFRRRVSAREQRFLAVEAADLDAGWLREPPAAGFRLARTDDLAELVDFACRLHVEDRMGPPIARSARSSVRARMVESVGRDATWVVERGGVAVGKADLSLRSSRRGAQISGVYVDARWRGRGVAAGLVSGMVRLLIADGIPAVTLHVRADNAPAMAAYARAGMTDRGRWILALR